MGEGQYSSAELITDESRRMQRQAALASNFQEGLQLYGQEHEEVELRSHQPAVLAEVGQWYANTARELGRKVLLRQPANAGKSTMLALIAAKSGVGKTSPDDRVPLRALTLSERRLAQTFIFWI